VIQAACWRGLDLERLVGIVLRARFRHHDEIWIKTNMGPIRGWGIKASLPIKANAPTASAMPDMLPPKSEGLWPPPVICA
jgi:hypothetical protein